MGVGTMPVLRSAILWLVIVILTLGFFAIMLPAALVALPFDRKRNTAHAFARAWARALLKANPGCTVIVEGEENLRAIGGNGASVLCCNHESMADIIALYYLGYPFKWISKREVFFIPLIGIGMWLAGYIPLKRGDKESIRRCMARARAWLADGVSIMMFPEGTRSFDGRLKAFKDGAFRMAVDTGVPIVPIAIQGPHDLMKKGSLTFASGIRIHVRVGPPIRVDATATARTLQVAEVDRLRAATRSWILQAMADIRKVDPKTLDANVLLMTGSS